MTQLPLENLTPRQRQAYILRFRKRWRLRRIAVELGITVSSAGERVKRAQCRAGLGKEKMGVIRARQRLTRPLSLTDLEERRLPSA